jgi:hypothetical protein
MIYSFEETSQGKGLRYYLLSRSLLHPVNGIVDDTVLGSSRFEPAAKNFRRLARIGIACAITITTACFKHSRPETVVNGSMIPAPQHDW